MVRAVCLNIPVTVCFPSIRDMGYNLNLVFCLIAPTKCSSLNVIFDPNGMSISQIYSSEDLLFSYDLIQFRQKDFQR